MDLNNFGIFGKLRVNPGQTSQPWTLLQYFPQLVGDPFLYLTGTSFEAHEAHTLFVPHFEAHSVLMRSRLAYIGSRAS